jgi:hypothetical protein
MAGFAFREILCKAILYVEPLGMRKLALMLPLVVI